MELMSSVLCVLLAVATQALGKHFDYQLQIKNQHRATQKSSILVNMKGIPMVTDNSPLINLFNEKDCQKCHECMERALITYNKHIMSIQKKPHPIELHNELIRNHPPQGYRSKRDARKNQAKKVKLVKNNDKTTKSVSVFRYDASGEVYALKVKETMKENNRNNTTCQVYSVNRVMPCESPETEEVLAETRRNYLMTNEGNTSVEPKTTETTAGEKIFRKRDSDNDPPEFMPSIEDMTY